MGLRRTLGALEQLFNIRFEERTSGDDTGLDALISSEPNLDSSSIVPTQCPSYSIVNGDHSMHVEVTNAIEFSRHEALPNVLSGRRIESVEAPGLSCLPSRFKKATVLASKKGAPLWAMVESQGFQHHFVSSPIPELNEGEPLFLYFYKDRFFQLLTLIIFLRSITEEEGWAPPPLQACFMFDDPNLHWRTYGFIDFHKLAVHAMEYDYHACFATIPLDAWFVHKPTALLFQRYRNQISLLIHGNDHTAQELGPNHANGNQKENLRQALLRIEDFERRSGVEVARIMAPPHGACGRSTLGEMADLGFEAAAISRGSMRHYNGEGEWLRLIGMRPADIIAGLPVFPRFPISASCHNSILIAALLDQPIIAMGHHADVSGGLKILADLSEFVRSIGSVGWTDMKRISSSRYAWKLDGDIMRIKMYTRRIEVPIPDGVKWIEAECRLLAEAQGYFLAWKYISQEAPWKMHNQAEAIKVNPGNTVEIVAGYPKWPLGPSKSTRRIKLWPVLRRQITEARDRTAPLASRYLNR